MHGVDLFSTLDYLEQLPVVILGPEWENKFSEELVISLRKHRAERVKVRCGNPTTSESAERARGVEAYGVR